MKRAMPVVVLIMLVGAVFASGWFFWPDDGLTEGDFERIQKGMTEHEVRQLLKGPPYSDDPGARDSRYKGWRGRGNVLITVVFSGQHGEPVVIGKIFHNPSHWDLITARCRGRGIGALKECW